MRRMWWIGGALAAVVVAGVAYGREDPMRAYYGNTYVCYWPGVFQCHHWWGADGSETYFEARWLPEGIVTMKTVEGRFETFSSGGQWCFRGARGTVASGDAKASGTEQTKPAAKDPPRIAPGNNACQPIVDALPGEHWVKLHTSGWYNNHWEQYVLLPGRQ